ncbi:MAG: hypothetical protein QNK04_26005 [Myxococcota bacterium]|nr:hypothetical protein [Myxococcota bacterium]
MPSLELVLRREEGDVAETIALGGKTLQQATDALTDAIRALGVGVPGAGLTRPAYDLPDYPLAHGAPFTRAEGSHGADLEALARWYENAHRSFEALAARTPGASAVRCWPHHFDLATLVTLETDAKGEATRTVGVGLSPGDDSYAEPYWYVSPWPYPKETASTLPPLPHGATWHSDGFTSAIWTATQHVGSGPDAEQAERLEGFLGAALAASRTLAGA